MTGKSKKKSEIGVLEKIAYGSGDLASNFILVLSSTSVIFFYTEALKLNAAIIGLIMMASRLFDGVSDILMGFIMDKTKSKRGKARAWIYWLAIPISISMVLLFLVPNMGDIGKYIYVAITYNLVTTVLYTAINIPYGAMTALMTRDQGERMSINVFRMVMAQIGSVIINMITIPLVNALGGTTHQTSWILASIIYGVIACALFYFTYFKCKERVHVENTGEDVQKMGFLKMAKICLKNEQWLIIVGIWVVMSFGLGAGMSVNNYYAKLVLGNENIGGIITSCTMIPAIILMPALLPLVAKWGKRNMCMIGCLISLAGSIMMLVNPYDATWLIICNLIKGVGMTPLTGSIFAMVADTIEYGQWKTGTRTEGMLYSSTTFGAKIGAGVGTAIAMAMLSSAGFVEGAALAAQGEGVVPMLIQLVIWWPIIFTVIEFVLFCIYSLDKKYPKVMEDLSEREAQAKNAKN